MTDRLDKFINNDGYFFFVPERIIVKFRDILSDNDFDYNVKFADDDKYFIEVFAE